MDNFVQQKTNAIKRGYVLVVFSSTEMWERYGFYVIQSLLVLYLEFHFGIHDSRTFLLVGSFTALTYISPIAGGWLADSYLGQKKAVLLGAAILAISYLIMAFTNSINALTLALSCIAVGTGLLKPNISSLLGHQYKCGDNKRDSAFTIFYMGITSGIILGTLIPIQLESSFGWRICFASAFIGLIIAFLFFLFGTKLLNIQDYAKIEKKRIIVNLVTVIGVIVLCFLYYIILSTPQIENIFFTIIVLITIIYVCKIAFFEEKGKQRKKTIALLLLCIISAIWWAFYFQMFLSLTLFITRTVRPEILGIPFPAPYYVTVESVGMIFIGIFLVKIWKLIPEKNIAFNTGIKFSFAMLLMLIAYFIIFISTRNHESMLLISPWPIIFAYLVISLAELSLSPIGLSVVTKLARPEVVSTMMGVFFVSLGIGGFLSGKLASLTSINSNIHNISKIKYAYYHGFEILTIIAAVSLIISLFISFYIKKLTN
jgi:proton-dependent oligopeptide transporter, POT family